MSDTIILPEGFGTIQGALDTLLASAKDACAELSEQRPSGVSAIWPIYARTSSFCIDNEGDITLAVLIEEAAPNEKTICVFVHEFIIERHPEFGAYLEIVTEW